jgi:DNA-binding LytR/AlgR family response regulator
VATSFRFNCVARAPQANDVGDVSVAPRAPPPPRWSGAPRDVRIVARAKGKTVVFIAASEVWAFEARGQLVYVHTAEGKFGIDLSLREVEARLGAPFLRVHRNWLVGLAKVRELGAMHLFAGDAISTGNVQRQGIELPVAQERIKDVRGRLLADSFGLRQQGPAERRALLRR